MLVALVLLAALLHASWNALGKASADKLVALGVITVSGSVAMALAIPLVPALPAAAWPFVAASVALHFAYQLTLVAAYRAGDLSQVYPIARGIAPLGVAVGAAVVLGERPGAWQTVGLVLASAAIVSLAFDDRSAMRPGTVPLAVLTGVWISCYLVVDGAGVRAAVGGGGSALSFAAWSLALGGVPIGVVVTTRRRGRLREALRREGVRLTVGGLVAVVGYGIVLWAFARETLWGVTALRETSVVFAALIGSQLLREPFGRRRTAAAVALAVGLVVLRLAG